MNNVIAIPSEQHWPAVQGHLEFPFWKSKIPPAQCKNSRKFPLWKYPHV